MGRGWITGWSTGTRAVSQLLWTEKDREVWFSLGENHGKACCFGLHQLRNGTNGLAEQSPAHLVKDAFPGEFR